MDRRSLFKFAAATGLAVGFGKGRANATIPEHNWDKYDWGPGPAVPDRLYQGPFPQYGPCAVVPDSDVAMVTTPSKEIVSNYGMGMIVYVSDDTGPLQIPGQSMEQTLEDLIKLPFAQKVYLAPTGAKCRSNRADWTSRTGGRLRSTWRAATTSKLASESNWRIRTLQSPACRILC